ncbi:GntR family transcriptional regulator [Ureibacillus sp. NPDC094379]
MKKLTLKEQAYLKMKQLIMQGEIKPGTSLTERELTDLLGMSRTPIRSALEKLEADGFIVNTPNKGPIITNISIQKLVDIYDLRIALESHVAMHYNHLSITDELKECLEENLKKQHEALINNDETEFSKIDTDFHLLILNFYGNEEITKVFTQIQNQLMLLAIEVFKKNSGNLQYFYEDHVKVYEYLLQNKGSEAAKLLTDHLEFGKKTLVMK